VKIRKSMMVDYDMCPYKFKRKYLDKIPAVFSPIAQLGTDFHSFADLFFDVVDYGALQKATTIEEVRSIMRKTLDVANPSLSRLCLNFIDFEVDHFMRVRDIGKEYFFPLAREVTLHTKALKGTVDRIDLLADDTLCVFEYKTSPSLHLPLIRKECAFYKLLVEKSGKFDRDVSSYACFNPAIPEFVFGKIHKNSVRKVVQTLKNINRSLKQNDFPKKVGPGCLYCDDRMSCLVSENLLVEQLESKTED